MVIKFKVKRNLRIAGKIFLSGSIIEIDAESSPLSIKDLKEYTKYGILVPINDKGLRINLDLKIFDRFIESKEKRGERKPIQTESTVGETHIVKNKRGRPKKR